MTHAYYTHTTTTVVDAPIEAVWAEVRDIVKFGGIVIGSAAENLQYASGATVDHVPAKFTFNLPGGPTLTEELTGRSDQDHVIEYRANVQVLAMVEYHAEVRLTPVTLPAGKTFIVYARTFRLAEGSGSDDLNMIRGIMDNEMVALRDHFARGSAA